ncbi:PEGA domain-containing protein [bacterium]|nr:PEGA domain-containing protein [bacterium]
MNLSLKRWQTGMSVLLLLLITFTLLQAQQLQQMEFEELKADNVILDDASRSLLIVESTIPKLMFHSNRGIKPNAVSEEKPGLWHVYLEPGVQLVTIMADGYLDIELGRHNYQPRGARKIRVTGEQPKGVGSLHIETTPSGATVSFNNLPVPGSTPLTLTDQPTGTHFIRIEKDGYVSLEETVTIEKDKTVTKTFSLQKEYAGLKVTSDPPGAVVFLDGDRLGTTPLELNDLTPGEGMLTVSNNGFEPNTQLIRLTSDKIQSISVFLIKQTGSIEVTTAPTGAEVFLDEKSIGVFTGTPIYKEKQELGKHTVRAVLEGFDDATETFTINYNKTCKVRLQLVAKPGALFVVTSPDGASIILDSQDTGEKSPSKISDLTSGQHELTLRLEGYATLKQTVSVPAGGTETVTYSMKEKDQESSTEVETEENKKDVKQKVKFRISEINYGLLAGLNVATFFSGRSDIKPFWGYCYGVFSEMSTNRYFSIQAELFYTLKGNLDGYQEMRLPYFGIATIVNYIPSNHRSATKLYFGMSICKNIDSEVRYVYVSSQREDGWSDYPISTKPEFSLLIGVNPQLPHGFDLDLRLTLGRTNIRSQLEPPREENVKNFLFSLILKYKIL